MGRATSLLPCPQLVAQNAPNMFGISDACMIRFEQATRGKRSTDSYQASLLQLARDQHYV